MQRLDHHTVWRTMADRETAAANARLVRSLARTSPHPLSKAPQHARAGLTTILRLAAAAFAALRGERATDRTAAPVGCA